MKLSKEPIAYITLVIVIATIVRDVLSHNLDIGTAINTAIIAIGGIVGRQAVTPLSKLTGSAHEDSE